MKTEINNNYNYITLESGQVIPTDTLLGQIKSYEYRIYEYLKNNPNVYFHVHKPAYGRGGWTPQLFLNYFHEPCEESWHDDDEGYEEYFYKDPYEENRCWCTFYCTEEECERLLTDSVRYYIANIYARKGYPHPSILWALHNCTDMSWTCKKIHENSLQERLSKFKKEKRERWLMHRAIDRIVKMYPELKILG